ncbi:hypothetical protein THAOC_09814 [Thalassiosira oceanica]|uniref:CS domain-containing protein n=1 Tax=Thalassiosira oceanica TaxID=159749 RepID=K0SRN8_THAOC|nr:hypothetical protein THAOC_09814 [Thalassiosira oceanica]|eukprot:EJK68973.1 hypothetical protein THAOC_09814 [Thalassiosira oceanica]
MSTTDEDEMTPEEREKWLKDRGIQIETASDRKQVNSIMTGGRDRPPTVVEQVQNLSIDGQEGGISFVYLPSDTSKPMSNLKLPLRLVEALGGGDVLPSSIDDNLMREQIGKQNLHKYAGSSDESMTKLSSAALSSVTSAGSVETFPLVRPSSTNKFEGVYIYLDEVGMLKHVSSSITFRLGRTNSENEQLPSNSRASKLAAQCGYSPAPNCEYMIPNLRWVVVLALTPRNLTRTAVYGDVFVGRVKSRPAMRNVDIDTEDIVDTSREWLAKAPSENIAWQQEVNKVTGRQGDLQPNHAGTEGVSVDAEGYSWTQTEEEIEITVPLSDVTNGEALNKKLIRVTFLANKVTVKYNSGVVVDVGLYSRLDVDGCTWTLDGENLVVTGEKLSEEIWPRLQLRA